MTVVPAVALAITVAAATAAPARPGPGTGSPSPALPAAWVLSGTAVLDSTPAWRVTDIDGHAWSPQALRGRVVLVDFWATWCAPCLADLPRLRRLHAQYASQGLTILGVSLDRTSTREFRSWLQRQAIGWPQVREAAGYDGPFARRFGVDAIPATFLYDRRGRLLGTGLRGAALEARVAQAMEDQ